MTILPPEPHEPRRPDGPRDPGDAWVVTADGERFWGRFGAAGLLAVDARRGVLLQHRVSWSHFGGTWGLPGGALHAGEDAVVGAEREAREEAGVPVGAVRPWATSVLDLRVWSYTTVIAEVRRPFEPVISDPESVALEWVGLDEVVQRPLHPGFAASWEALRPLLGVRAAVVVDAANVVGSVPDGWWRDRVEATARLRAELAGVAVPAAEFELAGTLWFPEVSLVVEGAARGVDDAGAAGGVETVRAAGSGDDAVVAEVERRVGSGQLVIAVTSDRGLGERVVGVGGSVRSAGWLRRLLGG